MKPTLRERAKAMHELATRYYIDHSEIQIGDEYVENWNTSLAFLTYFTNGRHLLRGDPSSGKTSLATLVGCLLGGIPPNVAKHMMVKGSPDLTPEDVNARLHYGEIAKGEETVIWPLRHLVPVFSIDEIGRVPTKMQAGILTGVEDGGWDFAGTYFIDTGKRPGFFTINKKDSGSFEITDALLDRFTISTEHNQLSAHYQEDLALANDLKDVELHGSLTLDELPEEIQEMVRYPGGEIAQEISRVIQIIGENTKASYEEKLEDMNLMREQYREHVLKPLLGIEPLRDDDFKKIAWEIKAIPFSQEARDIFFWWEACMNISQWFGIKRAEDVRAYSVMDDEIPDKHHAVSKIEVPFSNREQQDLMRYAKAIAWWTEQEEVDVETMRVAALATLSHRLRFSKDYEADHNRDPRDLDFNTHLLSLLLEDMSLDYGEKHKDYFIMVNKMLGDDFDPKTSFDDDEWKMIQDHRHPVIEGMRRYLKREYRIDIKNPAVAEWEEGQNTQVESEEQAEQEEPDDAQAQATPTPQP